MYEKTLTLLLERLADDNRLPAREAKRLLRTILFKIKQWEARKGKSIVKRKK